MTDADKATELFRRMNEHNARVQRWVWDCATILHDAGWDTARCFEAALDALADDLDCEACSRYAVFPKDHAFDCPLADNDDPAYVAHCILTEPEADTDGYSEATSPAGWRHP